MNELPLVQLGQGRTARFVMPDDIIRRRFVRRAKQKIAEGLARDLAILDATAQAMIDKGALKDERNNV